MRDEIVVVIQPDGTTELDAQGSFAEVDACQLTRALQEALGGEVLLDRKKPELLRNVQPEREVRRVRR
ncbi:MAG: hypothetical protein ACK47B_27845 [Armatimonadota bacterium]